jgi:serine/threonine protein kinase/tetratricopeptide (TPR) repeat protein
MEQFDDDQTQSFVALTKGTKVSHYEIIEKIGAGGMGEVYLAEDTELDRKVALKFLPPHLCQDEDCRARFKREAQAAAKLDHPNIVTVYEVSAYQGRPYFAMAHVEGQSLNEYSSSKELSIDQTLELGIQICEGLQAAHDKGITHRDIKPSNILIDSLGRARIVDFGLASVVGKDQLTKTGLTLGTIGYMSPEQVRGQEIDHRSDLFSLGVVLYELITRQNPFRRDSEAATLKAVSDDIPEPLARFKRDVQERLQEVVSKLLEKDRSLRYQHADGVISDLKRLIAHTQSSIAVAPAKKTSSRTTKVLVPVLVLIVAVTVLVLKPWKFEVSPSEEAVAAENCVAIMYFDNMVDPEDSLRLGEIATNLLITDLSESRYVKVISSQRLYDILKQLGKEGQKRIDRDVASQVAKKARTKWMLLGSILQVTPQIVITTRLVDVMTGQVDASQQITGDTDENIFSIVDKLTIEIKNDLSLPTMALQEPDPQIANVTTHSQEAYRYYLEGLDHYYQLYSFRAQRSFRKALELDSTFAMAYLRLALSDFFTSRAILGITDRVNAVKAGRYSGAVSRKERMYIESLQKIAQGDYAAAVVELNKITLQFPDEKEALLLSGFVQLFRLRQPHRAIEAFTWSLEVDPLYKLGFNYLSYAYSTIGDFERAIESNNKYISLVPNETNPYDSRGDLFAFHGNADSAIMSYIKSAELATSDDRRGVSKLANMFLLRSDYARADSIYLRMTTASETIIRSVGRLCLALSRAYRGELNQALQLLDQGINTDLMEQADEIEVAFKHITKACIYVERRQLDSAILETERGLAYSDSADAEPRLTIGSSLYIKLLAACGRIGDAKAYLKSWWEGMRESHKVDSSWYWYASGCIAFYEGDLETAVQHLSTAADGALPIPDGSWLYDLTHLMLARALSESGMIEAAVGEYENLFSNYAWGRSRFTWGATFFPIWGVKIPYYLGQAYEQTGQYDKAAEQYETFLETWKDADPGIQEIEDANQRLAHLKSISAK